MQKKVTILGAGESGTGAAVLAKRTGHDVFVSDLGTIQPHYVKILEAEAIVYESGKHSFETIYASDLVIKSPGIPDTAPLIQELDKRGIEVVDEIEFAASHSKATFIAVTGTNGKTTTTSLIYHLLKASGCDVGLAGNVGKSLAMQVAEGDHAFYALELSSFQLDRIKTFQPEVAVLLNITPDHLDRYAQRMEPYIHSKFKIAQNLKGNNTFIYNQDDERIVRHLSNHSYSGAMHSFSLSEQEKTKSWATDTNLVFKKEKEIEFKSLPLQGPHNRMNMMAAVMAVRAVGLNWNAIQEHIRTFRNVAHRMEYVDSIGQVQFINDSKATNVEAAKFALQSFDQKIHWIAGGTDKGNRYEDIMELVNAKVESLVCLGIENRAIKEAFHDYIIQILETQNMEEAVHMAFENAEPNEVVLLSPACASFDLFKNYEDRGEQFKAAVAKLKEGNR